MSNNKEDAMMLLICIWSILSGAAYGAVWGLGYISSSFIVGLAGLFALAAFNFIISFIAGYLTRD